ncbi:hypothetical protein ACVW0P_000680 [Mucilaginibacter sp. UYNi724]
MSKGKNKNIFQNNNQGLNNNGNKSSLTNKNSLLYNISNRQSRKTTVDKLSKSRRLYIKVVKNSRIKSFPMIKNEKIKNLDEAPADLQALYKLSVINAYRENKLTDETVEFDKQIISDFNSLNSEIEQTNEIKKLELIGYGTQINF